MVSTLNAPLVRLVTLYTVFQRTIAKLAHLVQVVVLVLKPQPLAVRLITARQEWQLQVSNAQLVLLVATPPVKLTLLSVCPAHPAITAQLGQLARPPRLSAIIILCRVLTHSMAVKSVLPSSIVPTLE